MSTTVVLTCPVPPASADVIQSAPYSCPHCQRHERSHLKSFQVLDLDRKHTCSSCKRSTPVRQWRCNCDILWHMCSLHATVGAHPASCPAAVLPPLVAKNPSRKRKSHLLEMGTFEDILDDDLRYHATKVGQGCQLGDDSVISLGQPLRGPLRPSCLSPYLRERFASSLTLS